MKICCILIFAVAMVIADEGPQGAYHEKLKTILDECKKDNATTSIALCFFHKLGIQELNGDINKDSLRASLQKTPSYNDADFINKVLAECGDRKGATAADAALALDICLKNNVLSRCRGCTLFLN